MDLKLISRHYQRCPRPNDSRLQPQRGGRVMAVVFRCVVGAGFHCVGEHSGSGRMVAALMATWVAAANRGLVWDILWGEAIYGR